LVGSCIEHNGGSLSITNCDFDSSYVYAYTDGNSGNTGLLRVISNEFSGLRSNAAISLNTFPNYQITGNRISDCETAIRLYESGNGTVHQIIDNVLYGNQFGYGIQIYHSRANITGANELESNYIGIAAEHSSNVNVIGNTTSPYQTICNHYNDECVFMDDSFPTQFLNNILYDNLYSDEHYLFRLVFSGLPYNGPFSVEYNYWGDNPKTYLSPSAVLDCDPDWIPNNTTFFVSDPDLDLYRLAQFNFENSNFLLAKQQYKSLIDNYPESKYASAAANELLALEEYLEKNWDDLQLYYLTDPNLHYDERVSWLADYLATYCNIKKGDYEAAINWFEDVIENPPSEADSIYAVIDLGYTYLLMGANQGGRSYTGRLTELVPASRKSFDATSDALMAKLLEHTTSEFSEPDLPAIPLKFLVSNYPNPFNPTTTIAYSLPLDTNIEIKVYNIRGQLVRTLVHDYQTAGKYSVVWDGRDQTGESVGSGVYFYRLISKQNTIVKKMLMLK
jgi:TolA-binding protein